MYNFIGEYRVKMDSKGRVKLPKDLLRELDPNVSFPLIVNRGNENNLMIYPRDVWEEKTKKIKQLKINGRDKMEVMRYFYRGASKLTLDSIERILFPKFLIDYAKLEKDVVLYSVGEQIEVWDVEEYDKAVINEPQVKDDLLDLMYGVGNVEQDLNID